jgi:hypothetical protein
MSKPTITILTPQQITEIRFEAVYALIVEGGEVSTTNLAEYLKSAYRIGVTICDGQVACVGAIKAARANYIRGVSSNSGYPLEAEGCIGEFGYVVTQATFRRRGLARALSARVLKDFGGVLYATTRDDNPGIQTIVTENGFVNVGRRWRSTAHPNSSLMLWLKK